MSWDQQILAAAEDGTVAGPGVFVQFLEVADQAGSQRVEVDVAHQLQKIRIFFADHGFVSVLKKVAAALVSFVKGNGIPGHEAAHDFAERGGTCAQKEMKMVWNQSPGVALCFGFLENDAQAFEEGLAVLVISKDFSFFYPSGHHVLEEAGSVESWLAWHSSFLLDRINWIFWIIFLLCQIPDEAGRKQSAFG